MPKTGARVELRLAAGWTDITTDVYLRDRISIKRGRQDEESVAGASTCGLTINNKGGKYSPRNPLSPLYGQLGRNTPIRVSTTGGPVRLRLDGDPGSYATTPYAAALGITGDLDVRVEVTASVHTSTTTQMLIGRYGTTVANRSWVMYTAGGQIAFSWYDTSGVSRFVSWAAPADATAFRATLDVDNGSGGFTASLYASTTGIAGPWTLLASYTDTGVTTLRAGSDPLHVGASAGFAGPTGDVQAAEVRSGIGGVLVAHPVFTDQTDPTTTFTDSTSRVWTLAGGAAIDGRRIRFAGEVAAWPTRWDRSGRDVYVPVQAAGITRRLGQGADPLQSTLRRRIPSDPSLIAYWPMEEGQNATRVYSPTPGVTPLTVSGMTFAADDTLGGSDALPTVAAGARLLGPVPLAPTGAWHIEFVYKVDTAPASGSAPQILAFATTSHFWWIGADAGAITITVATSGGDAVGTYTITPPTSFFGLWSRFKIQARQSGSSVAFDASWTNIGGGSLGISDSFTGSVGAVTGINTTFGIDGMAIGHLAVFNQINPTIYDNADTGFDGETADARLIRLATEEGIPLRMPPGPASTTRLGPQRPAAFLDLMQEAADADMGILYEPPDVPALAFRSRVSLYNQPVALTLDYAARGEVAPDLEPDEDDQTTANDVTRSRPSGSSARAVLATGPLSVLAPPDGVGRYTDSQTVNVHSDDQLPDIAGWALHLGTWDEARYGQVLVNLAAGPWLTAGATTLDCGDRMQIISPPPWLPPGLIDLIVQGYTETIGVYDWTIAFNCTPGGPWTVGVVGDAVLGRVGPGGLSTLAADATATATTLSVAVASGPLWRTTTANYPLDLRIAGEVVTLTAVSGASSPQTFTVTRGANGITKPLPAGSVIELATPSIVAL